MSDMSNGDYEPHHREEVDFVIYHAGCYDGFCAAWLCHKAFPNAEFFPCNYGMDAPDVTSKSVMIVDFSFKRPVLLSMKEKAAALLVLDHHKTAQADLEGLDFCTFDMDKSGGRLTWEHLFGNTPISDETQDVNPLCFKAPWLVDYTEDRDLWRHKLPLTKELNAALRTIPMDFTAWDLLEQNPDAPSILAKEGSGILRYQKKLIDSHTLHAQETVIAGHKVLCVNCTCADLTSEVAGALAVGRPFGMCWFESEKNERIYSLRSAPDGIDVSEIAKAHGGGGHKNAAGFSTPATGALGTFSEGQVSKDDEGDIKVAIAADKKAGIVRIDFGKPVTWLGLPKEQAIQWADAIRFKAQQL